MLPAQLPTASSQICKHFRTSVICLDYLSHTHNPELLTLGKSLFLSSLSIFVKVNSSLCLIKHQAMMIHGGKKSATYISNTAIRERWMFNSTSWPYPQGNSLWYLLNGMLCGPRPGLWRFGENENISCPFAPADNQIPICQSSSLWPCHCDLTHSIWNLLTWTINQKYGPLMNYEQTHIITGTHLFEIYF